VPDPTPPKARPPKATASQLHYLKRLAELTGQSFAYPQTIAQASREITRLARVARSSRADVARERRQIDVDMATRRGNAARVRADELEGYGQSTVGGRIGCTTSSPLGALVAVPTEVMAREEFVRKERDRRAAWVAASH
jgi:hypothetical protein